MIAFAMLPEACEEFFERSLMAEAVTEAEKVGILVKMAQEGKILAYGTFDGDKMDLARELSKTFNVLLVSKEKRDDE